MTIFRSSPTKGKACLRVRAAIVGAALLLAPLAPHASTVSTESGLVMSSETSNLSVFKAIPFAAPPVGALRWREPQSVKPWSGIRHAEAFAPACMQTGVSMPGEIPPTVSEDCLYLNIWTPVPKAGAHIPVMVWIYGGGFSNGSASMPLYWGDRLAQKGIVVVTFGYRLGPFGFLAHPELTAESAHHTSGNYGFLDQIAALRWVKRNIAAFGGDPEQITIAGQSAGAASVSILMASPLAPGLFERAIAESGGMFEPVQLAPNYQLANAEREGQAYAASLGAKTLAALRALPARKLLEGKAGDISHPVIDSYVLPLSPYDAFVSGRVNGVPVLLGSNADEARSLIPDLNSVRAATFETDIAKRWGALPPPLLSAYPHATDAQAQDARLAFERDLRFGWDIWAWARLAAARANSPVYYYHFTRKPPFPAGSVYSGWGASHFAELWYTFAHLDQERWAWSPADKKLADIMSSYWVNFVKTGDPNGEGLPNWPRYATLDQKVLYLDDPIVVDGVSDLQTLEVFDTVYDQVRGSRFDIRPAVAN